MSATIWLTGLSGAGKSTLAEALAQRLHLKGERVEVLDGDELRAALSPGLGFTRAERTMHVMRVGFLADLLARNGVWAVVPVIAPHAEAREANRRRHADSGTRYVEVYVATSLEECRRRDVKGLYARAAAGELIGLTGVDDPYDVPDAPELTLDTQGRTVDKCVDEILAAIGSQRIAETGPPAVAP